MGGGTSKVEQPDRSAALDSPASRSQRRRSVLLLISSLTCCVAFPFCSSLCSTAIDLQLIDNQLDELFKFKASSDRSHHSQPTRLEQRTNALSWHAMSRAGAHSKGRRRLFASVYAYRSCCSERESPASRSHMRDTRAACGFTMTTRAACQKQPPFASGSRSDICVVCFRFPFLAGLLW